MISEVTRRDIFDYLTIEKITWSGRLDEVEFLSRLYSLKELPSTDFRFDDASGDIYQHRINNQFDWEEDWVFFDSRFSLLHGDDTILLKFLCEMLHPVVRPDKEECYKIVSAFNDALKVDGYEIISEKTISGKNKYTFRLIPQKPMQSNKKSENSIPRPIISLISNILSKNYTHAELNTHFMHADAPGEAPDGNKLIKCQEWLSRCNSTEGIDALKVLGKVLEDYMECFLDFKDTWGVPNKHAEAWDAGREKIHIALSDYGLTYYPGGFIREVGFSGATKTLEEILRSKDIEAIELEFHRAMENINTDPPASLTAACAIIESICKLYIEENELSTPKDASIKPLWATVASDLKFDPSKVEDIDLKKILTGLISVVDGIGALRTHAGSAHGRVNLRYKIQPRHARLAVHASHTLAVFLLESWDNKNDFFTLENFNAHSALTPNGFVPKSVQTMTWDLMFEHGFPSTFKYVVIEFNMLDLEMTQALSH